MWVASLVGNLIGSVALAGVVHAGARSRDLAPRWSTPSSLPRTAPAGPQLFWRAVLCNLLVCLGLWMAGRVQSDAAKAIVLWWALLAFIGSGFEHSIANMTTFSLGVFQGSATVGELARNLLWTMPGNLVGGGLLVGLAYAWIGRPTATPNVTTSPAAASTNGSTPAVAAADPAPASAA